MLVRITIGLFAISASAGALAASCDGFVDVDSGNATYCSAVTYVGEKSITVGCTDSTHYCPNAYVTRLQMALFLQRAGRGGIGNSLGDFTTTIGGGQDNASTGEYSTVAGGWLNSSTATSSTVSGGQQNVASGAYATVPGGVGNQASGPGSFAAGSRAQVTHIDSFLWCDGHTVCNSQEDKDFIVVASGGIKFYAADGHGGCLLTDPAGSGWVCSSDRNLKEHFEALDGEDMLRRVAAMPVTRWNVKGAPSRHIGPVSQDFYAAFGLGEDNLHIASGDLSGVALAAIQGLYAEIKDRDETIAHQQRAIADEQREIDELRERLTQVESLRGEIAALRNAVAAAANGTRVAAGSSTERVPAELPR